jgi:ribosomal protein S18 acetylase RimI-like enzyme
VVVHVAVGPADPADALTIATLHLGVALTAYRDIFANDLAPPTIQEVHAQWHERLAPDAVRQTFTATTGGTIIGVVVAAPDPIEPDAGHLSRLYVDTDYWGQGIGTRLYTTAIGHLRTAAFTQATLWVLEHNARARAWYEQLRWQLTGERKVVSAPAGIYDVRYRLAF